MISGFRREATDNCALLGHYAVICGNSLPTFRDNISQNRGNGWPCITYEEGKKWGPNIIWESRSYWIWEMWQCYGGGSSVTGGNYLSREDCLASPSVFWCSPVCLLVRLWSCLLQYWVSIWGRPRNRWRDELHLEDQGTGNTPNRSWTWCWWWVGISCYTYIVIWGSLVMCCTGLCCTGLYCIGLCCTGLYCTGLCCTWFYCTGMCCTGLIVLECVVLVCIIMDCVVLDCVVLDCVVLDCIGLCCTGLCCTGLYCIGLCCTGLYCLCSWRLLGLRSVFRFLRLWVENWRLLWRHLVVILWGCCTVALLCAVYVFCCLCSAAATKGTNSATQHKQCHSAQTVPLSTQCHSAQTLPLSTNIATQHKQCRSA